MWGTVAISLVWGAVIVTAWYMIFLSYNRRQATLVFEFDLDFPPGFNLEVSNHRWCGRTTRNFYSQPADWHFAQTMPLVLTSRWHWEREVTSMMNALSCRERQFLSLSFSCRSPHFTATMALESIAPAGENVGNLFETCASSPPGQAPSAKSQIAEVGGM